MGAEWLWFSRRVYPVPATLPEMRVPVIAVIPLFLGAGCGGIAVLPADEAGGGGNDGAGVGASPDPSGGSSSVSTSSGGADGACEAGFIELSGGARVSPLEAVCYHGEERTSRPVGYFYYVGPEANGTLEIVGCSAVGVATMLHLSVPSGVTGTSVDGSAEYEEDGVIWDSPPDGFSVTIDSIDKVGLGIEGSYSVTVSNGDRSISLLGSFRVCHVSDLGVV